MEMPPDMPTWLLGTEFDEQREPHSMQLEVVQADARNQNGVDSSTCTSKCGYTSVEVQTDLELSNLQAVVAADVVHSPQSCGEVATQTTSVAHASGHALFE